MTYPIDRPYRVGDVLNGAIHVYRNRFGVLVRLVAIFVVPIEVITEIVRVTTSSTFTVDENGDLHSSIGLGGETARLVAFSLLIGMASQLATAVTVRATIDTYAGRATGWRESARYVIERRRPVLAVAAGFPVAIAVAFACFLLPGIYFLFAWVIVMPVVLVEGLHWREAFGRSRRLVRGMWATTAVTMIAAYVFVALVQLIITEVTTRGGTTSSVGGDVLEVVVGTFTGLLTTPFLSAVISTLYLQLRAHERGVSITDMAAVIAYEHPRPFV